MKLSVIKVGGSALEDAAWLDAFAVLAARAATPMVVVHGGGPEVSGLSSRLDIPVQWVDGRRVTTDAAMDVATMVLSGRINQRVVGALLARGVDAIGLSGVDGALLRAEVHGGGELGRVGGCPVVRSPLLRSLIALGHVPVISPVSLGPDGGALNVNADEAATAIAAAMGADELLYLTNVEGVICSQRVAPSLTLCEAADLIDSGVASGGMRIKLEAALAGVDAGVPAVRIGTTRMLVDENAGTRVVAAAAVEVAA